MEGWSKPLVIHNLTTGPLIIIIIFSIKTFCKNILPTFLPTRIFAALLLFLLQLSLKYFRILLFKLRYTRHAHSLFYVTLWYLMMSWINVKIKFIQAKLYVRRSTYYFDCIACHCVSSCFSFMSVSWYLHHLACMCTCHWSGWCCMCVTSDLWVRVCMCVSAQLVLRHVPCKEKIFEAHSTHSIISFPVLNWGYLNQSGSGKWS